MINLIEIDIKEFKKDVFPEYKSLFPPEERKPYRSFKKTFKRNYTKFLKINYDNNFVGFFVLNILDSNIQIDYFAILNKYQSSGYGSMALQKLHEIYKNYSFFIEVEKADCGISEEDTKTRKKRISFYEKNGYRKIDFTFSLYNVTYSAYSFNYEIPKDVNESIKIYLSFYYTFYNKRKLDKNLKLL